MSVPLNAITLRKQIRTDACSPAGMQSITELADDIAENGLIHRLLVEEIDGEEGRYLLLAGERRLRALELLDWKEAPVDVRLRSKSEAERAMVQLAENAQRLALSPFDIGRVLRSLRNAGHKDQSLARRIGKSRQWVCNAINLAEPTPYVESLYTDYGIDSLEMLRDYQALDESAPGSAERIIHSKRSSAAPDIGITTSDAGGSDADDRTKSAPQSEQRYSDALPSRQELREVRSMLSDGLSVDEAIAQTLGVRGDDLEIPFDGDQVIPDANGEEQSPPTKKKKGKGKTAGKTGLKTLEVIVNGRRGVIRISDEMNTAEAAHVEYVDDENSHESVLVDLCAGGVELVGLGFVEPKKKGKK